MSTPSEEHDRWVVFPAGMTKTQVLGTYEHTYGRLPEVIHSPEESDTAFWWLGYVSKAEFNEKQHGEKRMRLILDRLDLKPEFERVNCSQTRFEHFDEKAQQAILAVGHATFQEFDSSNYNRIFAPKPEKNQ